MSDSLFLVERLPAVGRFLLDGQEGRHAADVRRIRPGETLLLTDGVGGLASALVTAAGRGVLDLQITNSRALKAPDPRLVIVQGIAKGDRGEMAVQAMTEVGVDEIVPWAAARSIVRWSGERGDRALERWRSTAREAAKQARRAWLPVVTRQAATPEVADRLRAVGERQHVSGEPGVGASGVGKPGVGGAFVLHEEATEGLSTVALPSGGEICLVVGPEGGIDDGELKRFVAAGAVPVRLGSTVLRTSTAGVAALAVLSARLGRW